MKYEEGKPTIKLQLIYENDSNILSRHKIKTKMVASPHITHGYRQCESVKSAVHSMLFGFNNESVNALTMIIGLIVATFLYFGYAPKNNNLFLLLYISVLLHVPISVSYHTLNNNTDFTLVQTALKLDITATLTSSLILVYVLSATVFEHNYLFYTALAIYTYMIYVLYFSGLKLRQVSKTWLVFFLGMIVACYMFPMLYVGSIYGYIVLFVLLIAGFVYMFEIPERLVSTPYKDVLSYIGNSHNIMHIMLVIIHVAEFMFLKSRV